MTAVQTQRVISMDRIIDIKVNRLSSALYDLYTCLLSHSEPEHTYTKHITVKFSLYQYPLEFNSI